MINTIFLQATQIANAVADSADKVVNTPQAAQPTESKITLWELLVKGGFIMVPIALLFVIAIYVFIERYISIKKASKSEFNFMNNIRDYIYNQRIDAALSFCRSHKSPIARMIEKGIKRLGRPLKEVEEAIEVVGKFEVYKLEKNIVILAIIAGIAPMFGFIGTIIGVIKIFHDISLAGDVSITTVSSGLYTKMVASAAGLIVGIIAFVLYHWLNIMVDKTVQGMERSAVDFIDLLQEPVK